MVTCWLCFGTKRIGAVWISDEHVEDRSMRRSNACLPQITAWFSCKLHQVCQIFQKLTLSHLLQQGSNILCHQLRLQQVPVAVQKRRETTLWWGCCCQYNNCKLCQVIDQLAEMRSPQHFFFFVQVVCPAICCWNTAQSYCTRSSGMPLSSAKTSQQEREAIPWRGVVWPLQQPFQDALPCLPCLQLPCHQPGVQAWCKSRRAHLSSHPALLWCSLCRRRSNPRQSSQGPAAPKRVSATASAAWYRSESRLRVPPDSPPRVHCEGWRCPSRRAPPPHRSAAN